MGQQKAGTDYYVEGSMQGDTEIEDSEQGEAELKHGLLAARNVDETAPKVGNHSHRMLTSRHIALSILPLIILRIALSFLSLNTAFAVFTGTRVVSNKPTSQSKQRTPWTFDNDFQLVLPYSMLLIDSSLLWCPTAKSGTSTFYNVLWKNKLLPEHTRCYAHSGCKHLARLALKDWTAPKPLSFIVVRNPWDRIRSAYIDGKTKHKFDHTGLGNGDYGFAEFVKYVERNPHGNIHWTPVNDRCKTGGGLDKTDVFQYDYIIKLEDGDLATRLEGIFEEAGVTLPYGVEKEIKNQRKPPGAPTLADYYREAAALGNTTMEELVESVGRTYADDIRAFGYTFPL
mmetsp:Transcript_38555/g.81099  ORF Transcript_38555/g.81099 Transcript_38555/m.81099 type:complete len:342 (-) Transcript_38555:194-1219(-)